MPQNLRDYFNFTLPKILNWFDILLPVFGGMFLIAVGIYLIYLACGNCKKPFRGGTLCPHIQPDICGHCDELIAQGKNYYKICLSCYANIKQEAREEVLDEVIEKIEKEMEKYDQDDIIKYDALAQVKENIEKMRCLEKE